MNIFLIFKNLSSVLFLMFTVASCATYGPNGGFIQDKHQVGVQDQREAAYCPANSYAANLRIPPEIAADQFASRGYCATRSDCDFRVNPHTYACTTVTFNSSVFPFYEINNSTWREWQQNWVIVTYVNTSGHRGPEFYMRQNPNNPRQPLGVYNVVDNSPMGLMWVDQKRNLVIENWNGNRNMVFVWDTQYRQGGNIRWIARTHYGVHALTCRDFNRNDKHHLLCAWDVGAGQYGAWNHQGYFGFLLKRDWIDFRPDGP
jgi:hypothetical protein